MQSFGGVHVNLISEEDVSLSNQLEEFWKTESYGATQCETKPTSLENRIALRLIGDSVHKEDAITRWCSSGKKTILCVLTTDH